MPIDPPRWLKRLLVAGATGMIILGVYGVYSLGLKADWLAYYAAGHFLLDGRLADLYRLPLLQAWQAHYIGQNITPFLYPPAYSLVFTPLALLPAWPARLAWLLVGLVAGLAAAKLSTRWSGLGFPLSIVALLAFPPFAYSLAVGQVSPLTLLIFCGVVALEWARTLPAGESLNRGGPLQEGLLAGLALYKPQQLIPLGVYWLAARRWRSILGLGIMAVLIGLFSYLISPQSVISFVNISREYFTLAQDTAAKGANISLYAWSPWVGALTIIAVLSLLAWAAIRSPGGRYLQAMLWLAPVIVAPYIIIYDMLLIILPLSLLVPVLRKDRLLQAGAALTWLSALLAPLILNARPITWAALLLFLACTWRALKPKPAATSPHPGIESDQDQVGQQ